MNSDEESKNTDQLDALAMISNVVKKLGPEISEAAQSMQTLGDSFGREKKNPLKNRGTFGSKNNCKKRDKKRFLLARNSNRINRQRIKGWKY